MFESDKRSALERLKKGLYSRTDRFGESVRHDVHSTDASVPVSWEEEKKDVPPPDLHPQIRLWYRRVLIGSLGFFVLALLVAGYTLLGGKTFVSVDNIDILIEGPASIAGGETLTLGATVYNKNATDMQLVDLIVEFPEGARDPSDQSKELTRERISVGDIRADEVAQKSVSAVLYGEAGAEKKIKFTAEYRTAGSNAIFFKEKYYTLSISSSPITLTLDALESVTAGTESAVKITVTSNTTSIIKDVLLALEYPFGWTLVSSLPRATYGDFVWRIADLAPGAKKTIIVRGIAEGQDGEERTIHAKVGIQSVTDEKEIATAIISESHTFALEKPFLSIDVPLNGVRIGDLSIEPGRLVRTDVIWTNNTPDKITNARIEVRLTGNALDRNSVSTDGDGYYDSRTNTIVWEGGRLEDLREMAPGATGRVGFSFYPVRSGSDIQGNTSIVISVTASGSRPGSSGTNHSVETATSRTVKLVSNISLSARALRTQGSFTNTGPIPPQADKETTYTVAWTLTNTSNNISRAEVRATLPQGVRWTGVISPSDVALSYDDVTGEIVWNAGNILGGGKGLPKEVAFQIGLTPNVSEIGTVPELVGTASVTAVDDFTGVTLKNSSPVLTTRTMTDIFWKQGDETVVE
jgi:hypothetical protein